MSAVWLACCRSEDFPTVERAIVARDEGAQVLRLNALPDLTRMFMAFSGGAVGAAVVAEGWSSELERTVRALSLDGRAGNIVVAVKGGDEACANRLLGAGATEVVDADGELFGHPSDSPADDAHARGVLYAEELEEPFPSACEEGAEAAAREADDTGGASAASGGGGVRDVRTAHDGRGGCEGRGGVPDPCRMWEDNAGGVPVPPAGPSTPSPAVPAPIVSVVSGRGGCGKTTIAGSLAWCAAGLGLRTALVDADFMFGNLGSLLGVDMPADAALLARGEQGSVREEDVERSAMRVAPGLTLWGPCALPEMAELVAERLEPFLRLLQREADLIVVDTSAAWGEATAAAAALCDRCLVVCDREGSSVASLRRAVELAGKLGVPKTKMVCVSNRCKARDGDDDFALRAEMASGLGAKLRVADAGQDASQMLEVGGLSEVLAQPCAFSDGMRAYARTLLVELGCPFVAENAAAQAAGAPERRRSLGGLPWRRGERHGRP